MLPAITFRLLSIKMEVSCMLIMRMMADLIYAAFADGHELLRDGMKL